MKNDLVSQLKSELQVKYDSLDSDVARHANDLYPGRQRAVSDKSLDELDRKGRTKLLRSMGRLITMIQNGTTVLNDQTSTGLYNDTTLNLERHVVSLSEDIYQEDLDFMDTLATECRRLASEPHYFDEIDPTRLTDDVYLRTQKPVYQSKIVTHGSKEYDTFKLKGSNALLVREQLDDGEATSVTAYYLANLSPEQWGTFVKMTNVQLFFRRAFYPGKFLTENNLVDLNPIKEEDSHPRYQRYDKRLESFF